MIELDKKIKTHTYLSSLPNQLEVGYNQLGYSMDAGGCWN